MEREEDEEGEEKDEEEEEEEELSAKKIRIRTKDKDALLSIWVKWYPLNATIPPKCKQKNRFPTYSEYINITNTSIFFRIYRCISNIRNLTKNSKFDIRNFYTGLTISDLKKSLNIRIRRYYL